MRTLAVTLFASGVVFAALAVPAQAGLVCATASELKLLQSAALQQQLVAAAQSCRMGEDYNRFVTVYRDRLALADQALKAFFTTRPRGEDYNAYRTRIAAKVSLRSQHDARFCESAQKVFDMALGRGGERNGLAPEPPQLIDTGYEGCRPVDDKLIEAKAAASAKVAAAPVPTARPRLAKPVATGVASLPAAKSTLAAKPVLTAEASHALALAPHAPLPRPQLASTAPVPQAKPVLTSGPKPLQVASNAAKPELVVAIKPNPVMPSPPAKLAAAEQPSRAPSPAPRTSPVLPLPRETSNAFDAAAAGEEAWRPDGSDQTPTYLAPDPPRRIAERQQWQRARPVDDEYPSTDDNVPNAYRPGAEWVDDQPAAWQRPPPASRPDEPPPGRQARPQPSYLVRAPDGHWVVVIGHGPRWDGD